MKSSYKMALIVAMVLCALAFGYYLFLGGGEKRASKMAVERPRHELARSMPAVREPALGNERASQSGGSYVTPAPYNSVAAAGTTEAGASLGAVTAVATPGLNRSLASEGSGPQAGAAGVSPTRVGVYSAPADPGAGSHFVVTSPVAATPAPSAFAGSAVNRLDPQPRTTPPGSAPGSAAKRTYKVEVGDTFSSIALMLYGAERHWIDIAHANPLTDPTRLRVGQVLQLPSWDEVREAQRPKQTPLSAGQSTSHVVRPGETLSSIATRYYRSPEHWAVIFDANREHIGANPDSIAAGMVLRIPAKP